MCCGVIVSKSASRGDELWVLLLLYDRLELELQGTCRVEVTRLPLLVVVMVCNGVLNILASS